ncbi:MAG: hypothetical protein J0M18_18345 [Ignavibacteria bacterium]|nr:hypothetical protein [Ignavibacteria bacterium]
MFKSKFIDLLATFSHDEIKEFERFIDSPFFNRDKTISQSYKFFKKFYPEFNNPKFTKENFFKSLYPGKPYNDSRVRNILSDLLKHGQDYITIKFTRGNPFVENASTLEALSMRMLDTLFTKKINEAYESIDIKKHDPDEVYLFRKKLEDLKYDFYFRRSKEDKGVETTTKRGENLVFFFLLKMLKLKILLYTNEHNFNIKPDAGLLNAAFENINLEALLEYVKKNHTDEYSVLAVHYYFYVAQTDFSKTDYYFSAEKIFLNNIDKFSLREQSEMLHAFASLCIDYIHLGKFEFNKYLLDVYKTMDRFQLFSEPDKPQVITLLGFRNIVLIAKEEKDYDWLISFLERNLDKIPKDSRDNMRDFSYALLEYDKQNYPRALEFISKVKYEFFYFRYDVKNLLLKCFYELDMFEQALYLITNYKLFLKQNKNISKDAKRIYSQHIKSIEKVTKLKMKFDEYEAVKFKEEMKTMVPQSVKWAQGKLEELIKKNKKNRR